jgi:hypothetical protein
MGKSNIYQVNGVCVMSITISIAAIEKIMVTKHDSTLERGKMYLGTYTFLISAPFCMMEPMDILVASEKNEKITMPVSR